MSDTSPEFQRLIDERYRSLAPEERLRLCTQMFDFARELVEASLAPGLDEYERKRQITERIYGREFADRVLPVKGVPCT